MTGPMSFRVVYKSVEEQEIDADIYLPDLQSGDSFASPVLINIHGGAFMLGSSKMVNRDQIQDCLNRGWVVVVPNHRLCPQVNLFEGPMQDCRDLLSWIYDGNLAFSISSAGHESLRVDLDHVFAFGTSSGGTLALSLGFGVPRPVAGIYDMYGPCKFEDVFWSTELTHLLATLPGGLDNHFLSRVFDEYPVPITGGVSLEGQAPGPPDFTDPRQAYAMAHIARGQVMEAICPTREWDKVDPLRNITASFPPTVIVHGTADSMVPIRLSQALFAALRKHGVDCKMVEIPGEGHTFAAKMKMESPTWELQRQGFDFLHARLGI